jgi:hypothetical protein
MFLSLFLPAHVCFAVVDDVRCNITAKLVEEFGVCVCTVGYEPAKSGGGCSFCSATSIKPDAGNESCVQCQINWVANVNRTACVSPLAMCACSV